MLYPLTKLTTLVGRSGGRTRDAAIAEAERRVEGCRAVSLCAIDTLIAALEDCAPPGAPVCADGLTCLRRTADRIISLATTFELTALAEACKRLCDLAQAFLERGTGDYEPIAVHIRAIRLLSPKTECVSPQAAETILGELDKVLVHYKVARLD